MRDQPARDALGRGQRLLLLVEKPHHDVLELLVLDAEDEFAEPLADGRLDRRDLRQRLGQRPRAGEDAERDHRVADCDADLGDVARGESGRATLSSTADSPQPNVLIFRWMKTPPPTPCVKQPRLHLLGVHPEHLARHAGHGDHGGLADVHPDAGRGAGHVGDRLGPARQECLHAVAVGHDAAAAREHLADVFERLGVFLQFDAGRRGERFARQVVERRPEAAGRDDEVGPLDARSGSTATLSARSSATVV